MGQGVLHEFLQPGAVQDDDVGPLDGLHVAHRQGVVVEAGGLGVDQQGDLHPVGSLGDGGGKEVDRVGGTKNVKVLLPRWGSGLGRADTPGQQKKSQKGGKDFFHTKPRFKKVTSIIHNFIGFVK